MTAASPELEGKIQAAFARMEPALVFLGCKVATEGERAFVRIYCQRNDSKRVLPPPYLIFRFDAGPSLLTRTSKEEEARYSIPNYK